MTWYGERPSTCDGRAVPDGITVWTAHRSLPCGTLIEITTGGAPLLVPVWDRGPCLEWTPPSRQPCRRWRPTIDLDLSAGAFARLAPKHRGVMWVRWRVYRRP